MSVTAVIDYRKRRKANLVKVCGGKCNLCGYNKSFSALEFHHLNPKEKEYGLGEKGICRDLEKDLAEIKKCILVCANCHREIEDGLYDKEYLYTIRIFSQEIANKLREEKKQVFTKTKYFCKECGKEISAGTKNSLCSKCFQKSQQICERPDRETLKHMIRNYPFTKIASMFKVSDNAIRKWCKGYNLPSKKQEINAYTDVQWSKI